MVMHVKTKQREYPVHTGHGILPQAGELIGGGSSRKFIISDTGVPQQWKDMLLAQLPGAELFEFEQGESSKNLDTYGEMLSWLAAHHASRKDMVIGLGGGVVLDMAGFAAATYMRGISYVNIPTTSLSQVDSGIGGKTAIDHAGIKNLAGAFCQPAMVIADTDTLSTLSRRQLSNGLVEAVKSGLIRDAELFEMFESDDYLSRLDEIIYRSLLVKKNIVEEDENETSVRKLLNFGHTIGHAYESLSGGRYLHGECVGMGMLAILESEDLISRLSRVLTRLGSPLACDADADEVIAMIRNDKKASGGMIDIVRVDKPGHGYIETRVIEDIRRSLR